MIRKKNCLTKIEIMQQIVPCTKQNIILCINARKNQAFECSYVIVMIDNFIVIFLYYHVKPN